eukprot:GHVH01002307.1.p1 GENE.GHVH01002307.1~~GHVH01002307.1.p1  ORF type:complete len:1268 (+),score=166.47 GHVH01002307.1:71-3874(+)
MSWERSDEHPYLRSSSQTIREASPLAEVYFGSPDGQTTQFVTESLHYAPLDHMVTAYDDDDRTSSSFVTATEHRYIDSDSSMQRGVYVNYENNKLRQNDRHYYHDTQLHSSPSMPITSASMLSPLVADLFRDTLADGQSEGYSPALIQDNEHQFELDSDSESETLHSPTEYACNLMVHLITHHVGSDCHLVNGSIICNAKADFTPLVSYLYLKHSIQRLQSNQIEARYHRYVLDHSVRRWSLDASVRVSHISRLTDAYLLTRRYLPRMDMCLGHCRQLNSLVECKQKETRLKIVELLGVASEKSFAKRVMKKLSDRLGIRLASLASRFGPILSVEGELSPMDASAWKSQRRPMLMAYMSLADKMQKVKSSVNMLTEKRFKWNSKHFPAVEPNFGGFIQCVLLNGLINGALLKAAREFIHEQNTPARGSSALLWKLSTAQTHLTGSTDVNPSVNVQSELLKVVVQSDAFESLMDQLSDVFSMVHEMPLKAGGELYQRTQDLMKVEVSFIIANGLSVHDKALVWEYERPSYFLSIESIPSDVLVSLQGLALVPLPSTWSPDRLLHFDTCDETQQPLDRLLAAGSSLLQIKLKKAFRAITSHGDLLCLSDNFIIHKFVQHWRSGGSGATKLNSLRMSDHQYMSTKIKIRAALRDEHDSHFRRVTQVDQVLDDNIVQRVLANILISVKIRTIQQGMVCSQTMNFFKRASEIKMIQCSQNRRCRLATLSVFRRILCKQVLGNRVQEVLYVTGRTVVQKVVAGWRDISMKIVAVETLIATVNHFQLRLGFSAMQDETLVCHQMMSMTELIHKEMASKRALRFMVVGAQCLNAIRRIRVDRTILILTIWRLEVNTNHMKYSLPLKRLTHDTWPAIDHLNEVSSKVVICIDNALITAIFKEMKIAVATQSEQFNKFGDSIRRIRQRKRLTEVQRISGRDSTSTSSVIAYCLGRWNETGASLSRISSRLVSPAAPLASAEQEAAAQRITSLRLGKLLQSMTVHRLRVEGSNLHALQYLRTTRLVRVRLVLEERARVVAARRDSARGILRRKVLAIFASSLNCGRCEEAVANARRFLEWRQTLLAWDALATAYNRACKLSATAELAAPMHQDSILVTGDGVEAVLQVCQSTLLLMLKTQKELSDRREKAMLCVLTRVLKTYLLGPSGIILVVSQCSKILHTAVERTMGKFLHCLLASLECSQYGPLRPPLSSSRRLRTVCTGMALEYVFNHWHIESKVRTVGRRVVTDNFRASVCQLRHRSSAAQVDTYQASRYRLC